MSDVTDPTDPGNGVVFNPLQPGFAEDPYPHLAEMRTHDPVHESVLGMVMLFRYADVFALLRDPDLSVDDANAAGETERRRAFAELAEEMGREPGRQPQSILGMDPPDHTRIRKLVSKAFTPRMVEGLRERIEQLVDDALDRATNAGPVWDLVPELAFPLPFQVITDMLGMPDGDRDEIRDWSHTLAGTLDPVLSEDQMRAAFAARENMDEFVTEAIAWKRQNPADDLLSGLIAAEEDGDRLSEIELLDQVVLLYIAGHETTVNLIGNGTLALLRHRAELERWQADPDLDRNAVDELLRYDPPVQFSRRITLAPYRIDDVDIAPNTFVMTNLASANRDEAKWGPTADRVDLRREGASQHLAFGSGMHHCLGASLARLEGSVAIGRLIRRFPDLDLAGEPVHNGRLTLRGLDSLPLDLGSPSPI